MKRRHTLPAPPASWRGGTLKAARRRALVCSLGYSWREGQKQWWRQSVWRVGPPGTAAGHGASRGAWRKAKASRAASRVPRTGGPGRGAGPHVPGGRVEISGGAPAPLGPTQQHAAGLELRPSVPDCGTIFTPHPRPTPGRTAAAGRTSPTWTLAAPGPQPPALCHNTSWKAPPAAASTQQRYVPVVRRSLGGHCERRHWCAAVGSSRHLWPPLVLVALPLASSPRPGHGELRASRVAGQQQQEAEGRSEGGAGAAR